MDRPRSIMIPFLRASAMAHASALPHTLCVATRDSGMQHKRSYSGGSLALVGILADTATHMIWEVPRHQEPWLGRTAAGVGPVLDLKFSLGRLQRKARRLVGLGLWFLFLIILQQL